MIKLIAVVGKLPGWSDEEWYSHYHDHHGPLVAATAEFTRYAVRYRQNYVLAGSAGAGALSQTPRNGVTELWFPNVESLASAFETAAYRTMIRPDEARFAHPESIIAGVGTEHEILAAAGPSSDKEFALQPRTHVFIFRRPKDPVRSLPAGVRRYVQTRFAPNDFALGIHHRYSVVDEFWFDDEQESRRFSNAHPSSSGRGWPADSSHKDGSPDDALVLVTRSHVVFNPEVPTRDLAGNSSGPR